MLRVKVIAAILLITIGFIFNGELYVLYLDNFYDNYYQASFDFDPPDNDAAKKIVHEFTKAGHTHDVDFFFVDDRGKVATFASVEIYGTQGAIRKLKSRGLREGKAGSFFFSDVYVKFHSVDDISQFVLEAVDHCYFTEGDDDLNKMDAFKSDLVEQYGGGFPREGANDQETYMNLTTVWTIIFSILLLITWHDVIFRKKEIAVRVTLGYDIFNIVIRNVGVFMLLYAILFATIPLMLHRLILSETFFKYKYVGVCFCVFIFLNTLIYLSTLHINFQRDMGIQKKGKNFIIVNYFLKFITGMLIMLIVSMNASEIHTAFNLRSQENFFRAHKNFAFCELNFRNADDSDFAIQQWTRVYQKFYEQNQKQAIVSTDLTRNFSCPYPVIVQNKTAMKLTVNQFPQIKSALKKRKKSLLLLYPENLRHKEASIVPAKEIAETYFEPEIYGYVQVIKYSAKLDITGIRKEDEYITTLYRNPIIIFDSSEFHVNHLLTGYDFDMAVTTMYQISEKKWGLYVKQNNMESEIAKKSNVYAIYDMLEKRSTRTLQLMLILTAFLIILEAGLILMIIFSEYQVNSMELAVKKILGYSLFRRNQRLLWTSILSSTAGLVLSSIICHILHWGIRKDLFICWIGIIVLETVCILWKARKIENIRIMKALKGGGL